MISGIGGAFLLSNDTKRLAAWYRDYLGIVPQGEDAECSSIYASFEYRDLANPEIKRTIAWAIMPTKEDIKDTPRTGKINYTVKNMAEILSHLRSMPPWESLPGLKILMATRSSFGSLRRNEFRTI
jgi:hypothetical protein